jgi:hypothetical protein
MDGGSTTDYIYFSLRLKRLLLKMGLPNKNAQL